MASLSDRQQKMLEFIVKFCLEAEFPPTIREIGEEVGISSTSVVNYNLTRLEEAELLIRHQKVSRGLALNWAKLVELNLVDESDIPPIMAGHMEARARTARNGNGTHADGEFVLPRVPLLGTIAAGEPIQVDPSDTSNPIDWVDISESMLAPDKLGQLDGLYALKVQGDSMIDASIKDGDIIILRHQQQADNGQMVAAWIDGEDETTLKYWHAKGKNVELVPDNPTFKPMIYSADKVRVVGQRRLCDTLLLNALMAVA